MNNKVKLTLFSAICLLTLVILPGVSAATWINLNGSGEVQVNDANSLDGFSQATWNIWVKESKYNNNAGLFGKYTMRTGERSYVIRTSLLNGTSVIISQNGNTTGTYSSAISRACGIRKADEWTMITVTYDGSIIKYYRNGVLCDQDKTNITSIRNSPSPLRIGGGNNVFFNGGIDEAVIYNKALQTSQISRLYNESAYGSNLGQSIPVLVYHRIENIDDPIAVSPEQFAAQMAFLKQNGFQTVTLAQYAQWRKNNFTMPPKAVILVFDDGWKTVYTQALPVMQQYGFVGSLATVTRYADFINSANYMKWSEVQNLKNAGWSIESHGVSHSHMLSLSEQQFRSQLAGSKQNITSKIGIVPTSFVFPFHEANKTYTQICGEYYELCWTQGSPNPSYTFKSTPGKEYLGLRRINIINTMNLNDYAVILSKDTFKAGEWNMNEGSGSTTKDSASSNTAFLSSGATWASSTRLSGFRLMSVPRTVSGDISSLNYEDNPVVVDTDLGKPLMPIREIQKWPDNMIIEHDHYYEEENLVDKKNKTKEIKKDVKKLSGKLNKASKTTKSLSGTLNPVKEKKKEITSSLNLVP